MKRQVVVLHIVIAAMVFLGCVSEVQTSQEMASLQQVIKDTCFEVVVRRVEQDSLTYERELPWELLPYSIRNDQYLPVGTAFAISETEFVTASHVLHLMDNSRLYTKAYIRDENEDVYPIDNVLSFHDQKDFAIFTAKGKESKHYLQLRPSFTTNEPVSAVGDIYGQGIVAVPGNIVGTVPETVEGQWNYIKSSPPNGEGSSGGPLLDRDMNVVGIIKSKDDNFSYSLPISEMQNNPKNMGIFHGKISFGFGLMPQKTSGPTTFDLQIQLPKPLNEIRNIAHSAYVEHCRQGMDDFFDRYKDELFPVGETSAEVLQGSCFAPGVQVVFKNSDDNKWYYSNLEKTSSSLPNNGGVYYKTINYTAWLDLVKPDNVTHTQLYSDPKLAMDLILQGINMPRWFAGQSIRILSLDNPYDHDIYKDAFQRNWEIHYWQLEYSDEVAILFSTPTPDGLTCILRFCNYCDVESWLYDIKKFADFTFIPYEGTLDQWKGFLQQREYLYGLLSTTQINYTPGRSLRLDTEDFTLSLDNSLFAITDEMYLSFQFDFYLNQGKVVWGLRRINLSEAMRDNYFMAYRKINPPEGLDRGYAEEWDSFKNRKHPYNATPFTQDGTTGIGTVHPSYIEDSPYGYVLFIGREGAVAPETMREDLKELENSLHFLH